jgi:hypothetical protein
LIYILPAKLFKLPNGGDLVSTWVAKPEGHVEDETHLVKYVSKQIVAKKHSNDAVYSANENVVELAAA